jgi:hypothetical protein
VPIFVCQKNTNLKCKNKKAARKLLYKKAAHIMLVKLNPVGVFTYARSIRNGFYTHPNPSKAGALEKNSIAL